MFQLFLSVPSLGLLSIPAIITNIDANIKAVNPSFNITPKMSMDKQPKRKDIFINFDLFFICSPFSSGFRPQHFNTFLGLFVLMITFNIFPYNLHN